MVRIYHTSDLHDHRGIAPRLKAMRRAEPGTPPEPFTVAVCDFAAGMLLVQGILLALMARATTGRGQLVTSSLFDSMLYMQQQEAACMLNAGQEINWSRIPASHPDHRAAGEATLAAIYPDARNPFAQFAQPQPNGTIAAVPAAPVDRRQQWGLAAGGPLRGERLPAATGA